MVIYQLVVSLRQIQPDVDIQQSIAVVLTYESKVFQASPDQVGAERFTVVEWDRSRRSTMPTIERARESLPTSRKLEPVWLEFPPPVCSSTLKTPSLP